MDKEGRKGRARRDLARAPILAQPVLCVAVEVGHDSSKRE